MAPTEVLAEQHAATVRRPPRRRDGAGDPRASSGDRPLRVELLTNRVTGQERRDIAGRAGRRHRRPGHRHPRAHPGGRRVPPASASVVIDEQHRFGVEQRAALRAKGEAGERRARRAGHDGDADPAHGGHDRLRRPRRLHARRASRPGAQPIVTTWASGDADGGGRLGPRAGRGGRRAARPTSCARSSRRARSSRWRRPRRPSRGSPAGDLAGLRLGLLHGRLPSAEKEAIMGRFRAGELDVLVATTVIEVGVDVPNATVMVILDADRFGIAQLHQLRGRVGRGREASTCFLVGERATRRRPSRPRWRRWSHHRRLRAGRGRPRAAGRGHDHEQRQKGRNDLKLASLRRDRELVAQAAGVGLRARRRGPGPRGPARAARRAGPVPRRGRRGLPLQVVSPQRRDV